MAIVELNLPYPPSLNHYWRHVGPKVLISAKGRQYREAVGVVVLERRLRGLPLTGRLALEMTVHPPDRRRRDLDNALKAALDALQKAGVYEDDSQIDLLLVQRADADPGGFVVVHVGPMDEVWEEVLR